MLHIDPEGVAERILNNCGGHEFDVTSGVYIGKGGELNLFPSSTNDI